MDKRNISEQKIIIKFLKKAYYYDEMDFANFEREEILIILSTIYPEIFSSINKWCISLPALENTFKLCSSKEYNILKMDIINSILFKNKTVLVEKIKHNYNSNYILISLYNRLSRT